MIIDTQSAKATLLVKSLKANGLFSLLSGLFILLLNNRLSQWFGQIDSLILVGLGVGLILFSLRLFYLAGPGRLYRLEAKMIIGSDIAWVVGSVVLLAWFFAYISLPGILAMVLVSIVVGLFALFQSKGLTAYLVP